MIVQWITSKLEPLRDSPRILISDPHQLLARADNEIDNFATANNYTVIIAATNLVFRELYERAIADPDTNKVLVIDRTPQRRRQAVSAAKAPPTFYPDLLAETSEDSRIMLDLRQFLKETTHDPNWPEQVNDYRYARIIVPRLEKIIRAHNNLRTAHEGRFTDRDLQTIVAYAALGIPDSAFKKPDATDYWKIGLSGHSIISELDSIAPEITKPIKDAIKKAPAPFSWFETHDADTVIRAFYLSLIISQHTDNWNLLLSSIDPALSALKGIKLDVIQDSAPKLIALSPAQAQSDLENTEQQLTREHLQFLLIDQLSINSPPGFTSLLEKEKYSPLFRALALLQALEDLLLANNVTPIHSALHTQLFPTCETPLVKVFADQRQSVTWNQLKEAYQLAFDIQNLRQTLARFLKMMRVQKLEDLTFDIFWDLWVTKRISRLEYYLSALERLLNAGSLLPRTAADLPKHFIDLLLQLRNRFQRLSDDTHKEIDEANLHFQKLVASAYPGWLTSTDGVVLTSQFIKKCLKPHWDPQTEKAAILIFDGLRYEVWDELLRPMLSDRMELIADMPGCALLPSDTRTSRWAISAGTEPANFWPPQAENVHLKQALSSEFHYTGAVEPITGGFGETIRYRAHNLEVYIFEFCDKQLHKIRMRTDANGRDVPALPLAFVYQQHFKSYIDTEVMSLVRAFEPNTKVFITSDHGFTRLNRNKIWLEDSWLNEPSDCSFLHAHLKEQLTEKNTPKKVLQNIIQFPIDLLKLPKTENALDRNTRTTYKKTYSSIIFPRVGYTLARPNSAFRPDAFSHGGISMAELMIPMVVMKTTSPERGLLVLDQITGQQDIIENENSIYSLVLCQGPNSLIGTELRVQLDASVTVDQTAFKDQEELSETALIELPKQILYISSQKQTASFTFAFNPDQATNEQRAAGKASLNLTVTASYSDGRKTYRKSRTKQISVRLNSQQLIRRVGNLGSILGLTPKTMR